MEYEVLATAAEFFRSLRRNDLPRMQVNPLRRYNYEMQDAIETVFMAEVGELVARSALLRQESRRHHCRSHFPEEDQVWRKHTLVQKKGDDLLCSSIPVVRLS